MVTLNKRIDLLVQLGAYMSSDDESWLSAKDMAKNRNSWFTSESIDTAVENVIDNFLDKKLLEEWCKQYPKTQTAKKVGIVMAGNIPMVGFHDFLCSFISGHITYIKLSSKDDILIKHAINKLIEWSPQLKDEIVTAENLKGCDAYIATGSNNTARYFEQYFSKYPNIIRKNRTSVAIIDGNETNEDFLALGRDIFTYYGLGCRNVTKIYIPENYDINLIINGLDSYQDIILHHKYKNNYDYNLAIYLLNKVKNYTHDFLLIVENKEPFSPISTLHYETYIDKALLMSNLQSDDRVQAIVNNDAIPFGKSQSPSLFDYADNVDTMTFMSDL